MPKAIISDASCFILLEKIDALELLAKTYGKITTTPLVAAEITFSLPEWVEIVSPTNKSIVEDLKRTIDPGEASAIALALEVADATIILDDLKARKIAKRLGLDVTGTIGVLLKSKRDGVIPELRTYLLKIRQTSFRLSKQIEDEAFMLAGETDA